MALIDRGVYQPATQSGAYQLIVAPGAVGIDDVNGLARIVQIVGQIADIAGIGGFSLRIADRGGGGFGGLTR